MLVLLLAIGCRAKPRPSAAMPSTQSAPTTSLVIRYAKPLLDFSRGIGGLPLICSQLPLTSPGLQLALTEAHATRLLLPASQPSVIQINDETYPSLRSMTVDISGAQVRPDYKPAEFRSPSVTDHVLDIGRFEYRAWPVKFASAEGYLHILAEDVSMALLQENGQSCLVMTDARDGEMELAFSLQDLRDALQTAAKLHADKAGFTLRDLTLSLRLESPNQISLSMDVWGRWIFLPGHVRLVGRMTLDDGFNAHVSDVDIRGIDLGGMVMAGLIDKQIKQANHRVVPLVRFPGNRIQLRDVKILVDDKWRLNARFGGVRLSAAN